MAVGRWGGDGPSPPLQAYALPRRNPGKGAGDSCGNRGLAPPPGSGLPRSPVDLVDARCCILSSCEDADPKENGIVHRMGEGGEPKGQAPAARPEGDISERRIKTSDNSRDESRLETIAKVRGRKKNPSAGQVDVAIGGELSRHQLGKEIEQECLDERRPDNPIENKFKSRTPSHCALRVRRHQPPNQNAPRMRNRQVFQCDEPEEFIGRQLGKPGEVAMHPASYLSIACHSS